MKQLSIKYDINNSLFNSLLTYLTVIVNLVHELIEFKQIVKLVLTNIN